MTRIKHYEAIVIGAGSVGLPVAFSLAQSGVKTLVVDRLPSVGQGSNKHAIGGVRATHSEAAKIRLCRRSIEIQSSWSARYGAKIEWRQGGYSFVAYREQEQQTLQDLLVVQHNYGLNIDWLDAKALREVIPDLNPQGLRGGTYSPGDGSASPLLMAHAFYRHARRLGAEFRFGETVNEIVIRGGRVRGVRSDRGRYGADVVINAAGAWARPLAALAGVDVPVQPDAHEAGVTEAVQRFVEPMVVDIRPMPGSSNFYFYQHNSGQVIFCVTPSPNVWGDDTRETSHFLPLAARRMIAVMPRLRSIRVRRTWRGLYPMTPDGSPIVGWADRVQGFLLAVGMCGQGFMLGAGLGELVARMVQDRLTDTDRDTLERLSPARNFEQHQEKLK